MCTSGLMAAILDFRLLVARDGIYNITVGMVDLYMGIAVETALISSPIAEISVFSVLQPPYWISDFRLHMTVLLLLSLEWPIRKTGV